MNADLLTLKAQQSFPEATVLPEEKKVTFGSWWLDIKSRLETIMILWPEAPVTCPICHGGGCYSCGGVGRVTLGPEPIYSCCHGKRGGPCSQCQVDRDYREAKKCEIVCRLLMNARYFTRGPDVIPWIDRAIDAVCARWKTLFELYKPPF